MTEQTTTAGTSVPPWSGFHHIALVTRDLDATMRFYRDVLGMEIMFTAPAGDLHGRHCAIRPGGDPDRLGLHFFEYPQAPLYGPEDRSLVDAVFDPGATFLSHISLALPDEAAGLALQERLIRHNVVTSPIMDQGDIWNFAFLDNNGLVLEAAWAKPGTV
jgi:catechol 2,3-dioxygenase-like lactoylglutathione lyase family enzyme